MDEIDRAFKQDPRTRNERRRGETIMENQVEIWKAHPEYAGIEVSTLGRVRTLDRLVSRKNGTYSKKGRVLKQYEAAGGYLRVSIKVDGKWTYKYIHQLVAKVFIQNPDNLPEINHKDCDRTNNNVDNLEWCSRSYNMQYREKFGDALGHPVFAINLYTNEVSHFSSQNEASRVLGLHQQNVNAVIKGRINHIGSFFFVKDDENADDAINRKLHEIKKIYN